MARLGIPNQTVRQLLYGYLRDAYHDVGVFSPDLVALDRLVRRMALQGDWRPAIRWLVEAVAEQTGIRDYWFDSELTWQTARFSVVAAARPT